MIQICCALILFVSIFRFIIGRDKSRTRANMLLFSALIQSLMFYPSMKTILILKELTMNMDFTAPIENNAGICFPTLLACLFPLINNKKLYWSWGNSRYVLGFLSVFFIYSYLTPYNASHLATTIALIVILQIVFVIWVCRNYISNEVFIRAFFDAFQIIIIIELIISASFALLHINTLQQLFITELEGAVVEREGVSLLRASGTTIWPNRLGALCALIAIFFWMCYLQKYKRRKAIFLFVFSIIVIILSQSRSALLACTVSLLVTTIAYMYKKHQITIKRILSFGLIFSLGLFILLNLPIVQQMFFESNVDDMTEARFIHYILGYDIAASSHFAGVGINTNTHYMNYNMNTSILGSIWLYQHSIHNIYLVIFAELGILGLITWIWFLLSRIYKVLKTPTINMNNPIIWFSFMAMLFIVVIHGFTDIMYMHYQYILIISFYGAYSNILKPKVLQEINTIGHLHAPEIQQANFIHK